MKFTDGTEVKVGDRLRLSNDDIATVVFDVETDVYEEGFPKPEWEYLRSGIMVKTDSGALIHLEEAMLRSLCRNDSLRNEG